MEILSCEPIQVWRTVTIVLEIVFLSTAGLSGLVWLWMLFCDFLFKYKTQDIILSISGFILVVMLIVSLVTAVVGVLTKIDSGRYKYQVTLSPNYDLEELAQEYDIEEQCGKIWVIEDKKFKDSLEEDNDD